MLFCPYNLQSDNIALTKNVTETRFQGSREKKRGGRNMLEISRLTVEHLKEGCVTDREQPRVSFEISSDRKSVTLKKARVCIADWVTETKEQVLLPYGGEALKPFTTYPVCVEVTDDAGETATARTQFETGRMGTPWQAKWISDAQYVFQEKKVSPIPMMFRKRIRLRGKVASAKLYATALGIYELEINGQKVGDRYFAPGFTSYKHEMQYQVYDVTEQLGDGENVLTAVVAGGWAVGSFVFTRQNRFDGDRQAFLAELRIRYEDGAEEIIGTDESWEVTEESPYRMADLYDGETYDVTVDISDISWRKAAAEKLKFVPNLIADYGSPVKAQEEMKPLSCRRLADGTLIYDFGQNFAGVIHLKLRGRKGQRVTVQHAEILNRDGSLNIKFLRTAKASATYICRDGEQEYSPRLTYMGFRYAGIQGMEEQDVEVSAFALYSDMEEIGTFSCSDEMLNRLQKNIEWSSKSNFVDIPTDCPQRDERMGWTGDIAVFAPTACYNFDISRFLEKWLLDVRSEQLPTGGLPNTVPVQGYGFPATMPAMAIDWWGDACVLVPWAQYMAKGDVDILRDMYPAMKKYVKACRFWAGFGLGKHRYIWNTPSMLHFGDWVAPDVPKMSQWQSRSKWTATASLHNTSRVAGMVAELLGEKEDAEYFRRLSEKTADAYISVFTDGNGKLHREFQTGYVLPLYFQMFSGEAQKKAAENLVKLLEKSDYCIGTGFPGTPYILFALADNGQEEAAFKMLLNTKCPSWLYEVKSGATTIWERWDGLDENGECPISNDGTDMMISYNHYASGAVGAFLYQRIVGIEAVDPGYKTFRVSPLVGGGLTWAEGSTHTPYGRIWSRWRMEKDRFYLEIEVPAGTSCIVALPDGSIAERGSGTYEFSCTCPKENK